MAKSHAWVLDGVGNWIYSHPIIFYAMTFVVCVAIVSALMFVIVSIMKSDVPGA